MAVELITDDRALVDLCNTLATADWLGLDTEFMRERTYRAKLCLVQVATGDLSCCIDPLGISDLGPLLAVLENREIRKVMHAARQDIEVIHDLRGSVPSPVFDTQIAAAFLGFDDQIGYGPLVAAITGVTLAKTETRTDWSRRPLSRAQLDYAADDVRFLQPVFETLLDRLESRGRRQWVEQECNAIGDPARYRNNPQDAWQRFRGGVDLPPAGQQVLRALIVWREAEAQSRDLPRGWVVKDDVLVDIARAMPDGSAELEKIVKLDERTRRRYSDQILAGVAAGRNAEAQPLWNRDPPLAPEQVRRVKAIMTAIRTLAERNELAPSIVATRREIEQLVRGADPQTLWPDWRRELLWPAIGNATV